LSYGFILGELVQRVTGAPVRDVLGTSFLGPLKLSDIHLGLPPPLWDRHVEVTGEGAAGRLTQAIANRRATRQAVIPAAGISATARDVARFYHALLQDGELDGVRVLRPGTLAEARRPSSHGELDQFLKLRVRWSQGFQLGGPVPGRVTSHPLGDQSERQAFGHNGSNACVAWADPVRRLARGLPDRPAPGRPGPGPAPQPGQRRDPRRLPGALRSWPLASRHTSHWSTRGQRLGTGTMAPSYRF
jgi:CubicO group peptidase (beta-lactamase class C family)